jgi:hypothetical protein
MKNKLKENMWIKFDIPSSVIDTDIQAYLLNDHYFIVENIGRYSTMIRIADESNTRMSFPNKYLPYVTILE